MMMIALLFLSILAASIATGPNATNASLRGGHQPYIDGARALSIYLGRRWKDRVGDVVQIPYKIDTRYFSNSQKQMIESSIRDLAERSKVIRFVERTSQAAYVHVVDKSGGCSSYVGKRHTGKEQELNLSSRCVRVGTIQHEFLHALGFTHEQNRPDRDDYVTIHMENIRDKNKHNFQLASTSAVLGANYDYTSVLHYHGYAFAIDSSLPTITPRDPTANIGQRDGASDQDVIETRLLYQCLSGPRSIDEYNANPCTTDCKCWEGATGCNGNDDACQGTMTCLVNECILASTTGGSTGGTGGGSSGSSGTGGGCTDTPDWVDIEGDSCEWYEEYNDSYDACALYGAGFGNAVTGMTANDACCVCGGGSLGGVTFRVLQNADSPGNCWDVNRASTRNGAYIIFSPCDETPSQKFWVDNNGYIRSALDVTKCVVGSAGETSQGTNLILNDCFANDDRFVFQHDDADGTFRPKRNNEVCIGPSSNEVAFSTRDPILHLWDCNGSPEQSWSSANAVVVNRALKTRVNSKNGKVERLLQNEECSDVPLGWYDAHGDSCLWYADGTRCDDYGSGNGNFGKTANQACCACGGGSNIDSQFKDEAPLADPVLADDACYDTPIDWRDSVGDTCLWYSQGDNCLYYGDDFTTELGSANQACCACGGGSSTLPPMNDYIGTPGCSDFPDWIDSEDDGCDFYGEDDNCVLFGDDYVGVSNKTASEACCACGGGFDPSTNPRGQPSQINATDAGHPLDCLDNPPNWIDSAGDDCLWYEAGNNCVLYGSYNAGQDGHTASEACCVCGGGITTAVAVARSQGDDWFS
ncbi:metalloproteinase dpy-31 [Seminavis robusta]|uniref:Metalloendopeptidase n=1 Tax=Seminavis robusta TaxID=568900 RepID=A0A9N8ETF0_9STRA|nr:metalloproteinase dpy-31 [Seminavis robusta]|eukprot:Sro1767_g296300.1 metalloproteinase dpy-31 (812) ;mRNA; f:13699-16205